jgi:hypothetical protein
VNTFYGVPEVRVRGLGDVLSNIEDASDCGMK